jgi:hypothetical protein
MILLGLNGRSNYFMGSESVECSIMRVYLLQLSERMESKQPTCLTGTDDMAMPFQRCALLSIPRDRKSKIVTTMGGK